MTLRFPLILSILLSVCVSVSAQFSIKGQVIDSLTNETIPFVTIRVTSPSAPSKPVKMLATNEDGKFDQSIPTSGKYNVSFESLGKTTVLRNISLSETKPTLNFGKVFMNDDTQKLNEVTVTAQKPLVKVDIDRLTYSMEEDPEAKTNNALDMLRKVPLITIDGDNNIQLKGSSNYKIYVNGKPSNLLSGSNASDVLKSMPANSIKNVEVITDPGAKYDAEGVGGIINIIMAKNALDGVTGSVRANANTLGGYGFGGYISTKTGKLGLTANYGYNKTHIPAGRSVNEEFKYDNSLTDTPTHTIGEGKTKASGLFNYGNLEASLEIDTFNLVTVGANLMRGSTNNTSEQTSEMYKTLIGTSEMFYRYDRSSVDKSTYGAIGANVDYQHSTMKKDELLTISYNINREPNNSEGMTELTNVENYYLASEYPKWNINKAYTLENTGQIDYTRPIFKGQTIETGVKYINRTNRSKTEEFVQNSDSKEWVDNSRDNSDFKHTQHIYSAYLGYTLRFKKLGLKTGVRAEGTALNAKFAKNHEMDFKTDYFNVVPNATLTYQIGMTDQLKLGYNMRIQRPGIWYLNPYINDVNPQYVSQGNPDLGSEKSNAINLGYSKFGQKFSINANLSYTFINNSIESYNEVANFPESDPRHIYNGAIWGTYGNIGKKHTADMSLYLNWTPKSWFNIYMNGSAKYIDLDSKELNTSTRGWSGRIFGGTRFSLPKDWYIYVNGGYLSPQIQLQTKGNRYFFLSSNVNKDLLKKKLTISLGINNPFWKEIKLSSSTVTDGFSIRNDYYSKSRVGYISIAYKFGNLKEQIKKVSRGISNDDQISGGSSNSSGSGSAQ